MPSVQRLKERFYDLRKGWRDGTSQYLDLVSTRTREDSRVLDIGAGDGTGFAHPLRGRVKELVGLDPDGGVLSNPAVDKGIVGTAEKMPLPDSGFDVVVSSFTLEHVRDPASVAREVFRVLHPGGVFIFRTPNLWHYVTLVSRLTPQWFHRRVANPLRGIPGEGREPYPTVYRCNTRRKIRRAFTRAGFIVEDLRTIEPEPSYLQFSWPTFLLGVAYERLVNGAEILSPFRVTILGVLRKP
jgi:ubiquinone/menaquinone biosynthesis C-methylase UbiE